jgi:hypothetical protein
VLATGKGAALGGLLTLVVIGGLHTAAPSAEPDATADLSGHQPAVDLAVADHHCSYAGFGGRSVPSSALIRTARGQLRQVSFDVGWDVYSGRRPGTLIAVCLDEAESSRLVKVHS